jgi:hypothetical protein
MRVIHKCALYTTFYGIFKFNGRDISYFFALSTVMPD